LRDNGNPSPVSVLDVLRANLVDPPAARIVRADDRHGPALLWYCSAASRSAFSRRLRLP
jgi:hypothetical protein